MKKRYQLVLVFIVFAVITYLDRNSISVISKDMMKDLGLSKEQWGLVLGAFSLAYGLFEIPTGILVDKYGPKITLIRIVIWWSFFTIMTGFATSFYFLVLTRFLFGAGEAGAFPTVSVAIARWFPAVERGRIQSIVWMGSRLGGALAPFVAPYLAYTYGGWRAVFYILGALGCLWAIFWWFWYKDEPREMANISMEEVAEIEAGRSLKKTTHALLPWGVVLRNKNLWALMGMYHCLLYGAYFYMSWMPKYLQEGRGVSDSKTSFMVALPFILGMAGCLAGGFASDYLTKLKGIKYGRRYVGMFGLVMSGICMIIGTMIQDINVAIVFLSLGLAFKDFTLPVSWAVATDIGGQFAGSVAGTMGLAGQLGASIMASAFGYILTMNNNHYELPIQIIGCIVILGGLLWFGIDASKTLIPAEEK
jgi:MFS transporter, ACS family, glucarate transporter